MKHLQFLNTSNGRPEKMEKKPIFKCMYFSVPFHEKNPLDIRRMAVFYAKKQETFVQTLYSFIIKCALNCVVSVLFSNKTFFAFNIKWICWLKSVANNPWQIHYLPTFEELFYTYLQNTKVSNFGRLNNSKKSMKFCIPKISPS